MLNVNDNFGIFDADHVFFFVGIGGISMSALALIMQEKGYKISGYDRNDSSELIKKLKNAGIPVCHEYRDGLFDGVTHVVYTAAICDDDVMLTVPRSLGIPTIERSVFLGKLMQIQKNPIGVAGTHGKSSTSGMISSVFLSADKDPTVLVGAELPLLDGCYHIGNGPDFIFEACEYKDSFLDFFPKVAVVLNIALDHIDYFKDLSAIISSFKRYIQIADTAVMNYDCENCHTAAVGYEGQVLWFSAEGQENADYYAKNTRIENGHAVFDAHFRGENLGQLTLGVTGLFHVSNALATLAVAHNENIPFSVIQNGICGYSGVKRRFEHRGYYHGALVIEDYAHHPDEIRATVSAALSLNPKRLIALFQPHTYTRTAGLFDEFTTAFNGCDRVLFADIYAAREKPNGVTSLQLANKTPHAVYTPDTPSICNDLRDYVCEGDILLVMGAGTINEIIPTLLKEQES